MSGFAVIDLETAGFAYNANDRVRQIGVVPVAPAGINVADRRGRQLASPRETGAESANPVRARLRAHTGLDRPHTVLVPRSASLWVPRDPRMSLRIPPVLE